jgi:hypothetical protein
MICCLPVWSVVVRWGFRDEDGWSARWGKNRRSENTSWSPLLRSSAVITLNILDSCTVANFCQSSTATNITLASEIYYNFSLYL